MTYLFLYQDSLWCVYHDGYSFEPAKGLACHFFSLAFHHFQDMLICKASLLKALALFTLEYLNMQIETLRVSEAARIVMNLTLHKRNLDRGSYQECRRSSFVSISDIDMSCPLSTDLPMHIKGLILPRANDLLFSIHATLTPAEQCFQQMDRINDELKAWLNLIPNRLRPGSSLRQHRSRPLYTQEMWEKPLTMLPMFIVFDFVVHCPLHSETRRNLSYLDIVAAHYARLELLAQGTIQDARFADFMSIARFYIDYSVGGPSILRESLDDSSLAVENPDFMSQSDFEQPSAI
ncbi:hypothetical protein PSV08DRAFT_370219 [Bipolaris maydis]|uniref:uncharacterized protein n=1 Tax=Cochliobolus heterostrophus TaxID=5016 RepID=UPI0024D2B3AE|nr:hypothetical protein J3E73DRAFT_394186 [Bipolaris maydis]KAJ6272165.1 hypothetical protein PSV08DRAFT_370219 [Bipolaris maydis]KAJ6281742.1 hypothetical protein J3E71DRAFT_361888 [Bipolaris maydis]